MFRKLAIAGISVAILGSLGHYFWTACVSIFKLMAIFPIICILLMV